MIGNFKEAEQNFIRAKEADPTTAGEIDREISKLKEKERLANMKEKKEWANFLARDKAQASQ